MKKIIFRILGALGSALIIVSVFIPFVKVTGFSTNLWETYELSNALYLPIMIIVFGGIGVLFFSLNIKTEFAYMSTGALSFFLIMQTIDILDQGSFNVLSIGYYLLVLGTVLTGLMAFLCNLKQKKVKEAVVEPQPQVSMLNKIDELYNNNQGTGSNPLTNQAIEPLPIQPINTIQPLETVNQPQITPAPVNPVVQQFEQQNTTVQTQPLEVQNTQVQPLVNPTVQEFSNSQPNINPVVAEFQNPVQQQPVMPQVQPQPIQPQPIQPQPETQPVQDNAQVTPLNNPVVQEFMNSNSNNQSNSNVGLDIFGQ